MDNLPRITLLGTFVGRGKERQVGEICAAQGAFYTLAAPATGTAASEVLQVLGIGEISRTLTLSLVPAPLIAEHRQELRVDDAAGSGNSVYGSPVRHQCPLCPMDQPGHGGEACGEE